MMDIIENQIIPTYYNNKQEWARMMRQAIRTAEAYFNSDRMVIEYYNHWQDEKMWSSREMRRTK